MPLATNYLGFKENTEKVDRGVHDNAWYTLLSNIYNVGRSQTEERDRKKRQRRRAILTAIVGVVIFSLATLALIAWWLKMVADEKSQLAETKQAEAVLAAEGEREARIEAETQSRLAEEQRLKAVASEKAEWIARLEEESQRKLAEEQRNVAVARQLLAQSNSILTQHPNALTLSTLLALESLRHTPTSTGIGATLTNLFLNRKELARFSHIESVTAVVFSHDGTRLATASEDGTARVWPWRAEDLIRIGCSLLPLTWLRTNGNAISEMKFIDPPVQTYLCLKIR